MKKILADTNVLIDYANGHSQILEVLIKDQKNGKINLYVNPVIVAEFFTDKNLKNEKKLKIARDFFQLFETANINKETGTIAGRLLRENRVLFLADALIAATCLQFNLTLLTKNKKDFKRRTGLKYF